MTVRVRLVGRDGREAEFEWPDDPGDVFVLRMPPSPVYVFDGSEPDVPPDRIFDLRERSEGLLVYAERA